MLGYVARASGIDVDARRDHPVAAYGEMRFPWKVPVYYSGDVYARTMADEKGRMYRVKVKDPSFANWPALPYALLKNIVPDFPLCNKSFNQSYSGNDL